MNDIKRAIEQVARSRLKEKGFNPRAYCCWDETGRGSETYLQAEIKRIGKELSRMRPIIQAIRALSPSHHL